jgi:hypothetical protein
MENVLVIADAHDISAAEEVAATLDSYKVYIFDPSLVDKVKNSTLRNVRLIAWNDCLDYPELVKWSHAAAFNIERALDETVRELLPEASMAAWQHLNFYYFFTTYRWYSGLWASMLSEFDGTRPYIFICDSPLNFYWPSFLPAVLLLQNLKTKQIEFSGFTYGKRANETDVVPHLTLTPGDTKKFDILTHLPTCFYDHGYFNDELKASDKTVINIHPKYWGVPLDADRAIDLVRIEDESAPISQDLRSKADKFAGIVLDKLESLLTPYIASPDYRARQAEHIASMYKAQFITYHLLNDYFAARRPGKMLLSDHDAGFHGPLVSFAEKHDIPVLMVPHAKTVTDIEYSYSGITMFTHAMQGDAPFDAKGRRMLHFALSYPETFSGSTRMPGPLKKLGLLLNGFSLNGIHSTEFGPYMEGIRQIAGWCKRNGVELNIRCRPGQLLTDLLTDAIGIDRDKLLAGVTCTIQAFAQSNDVCLMYDAPTNADIEFLKIAAPILNPIPASLTKGEAATANRTVIPRDDVDGILYLLDTFVADVVNLQAFTINQTAEYLNVLRQSHPLRRFL